MSGMYSEKIRSLSIMLWESDRETIELRKKIVEQERLISDLTAEIYFAEIELRDMQHTLDASQDMEYMISLQTQVKNLTRENKLLNCLHNSMLV